MKHYIIVKFNEQAADRRKLLGEIQQLFDSADPIPGVHGFSFTVNCIDRPNRYDLMIVARMDKEALPVWDGSQLHRDWKDLFGQYILSKAIFDEE